MSDPSLTLPEPLDRFVEEQVASGAYPDARSVLVAGVRRLQEDAAAEEDRTRRFLAAVQSGVDQLDRGEGIEVTDVKVWLDGLGRRRSADAAA